MFKSILGVAAKTAVAAIVFKYTLEGLAKLEKTGLLDPGEVKGRFDKWRANRQRFTPPTMSRPTVRTEDGE